MAFLEKEADGGTNFGLFPNSSFWLRILFSRSTFCILWVANSFVRVCQARPGLTSEIEVEDLIAMKLWKYASNIEICIYKIAFEPGWLLAFLWTSSSECLWRAILCIELGDFHWSSGSFYRRHNWEPCDGREGTLIPLGLCVVLESWCYLSVLLYHEVNLHAFILYFKKNSKQIRSPCWGFFPSCPENLAISY